jgi:hypothetical protein
MVDSPVIHIIVRMPKKMGLEYQMEAARVKCHRPQSTRAFKVKSWVRSETKAHLRPTTDQARLLGSGAGWRPNLQGGHCILVKIFENTL